MKKSILLTALVCVFIACFALFMVSCNKNGNDDGAKTGEVIFRTVNSVIQWKYDFEGDDKWREVPVDPSDEPEKPQENEAYLLFKKAHPEYTGDEKQWLDDLVNDRLVYYAKFTVSFDTSGGSVIERQTVKIGETAIEPQTVPEKAGYDFVCWQNGDKQYDFSALVIKNLELSAKWSPVIYSITYDLSDCGVNSEENPETYTIESGAALKAPAANDGFKFSGWQKVITAADGTETCEAVTEIRAGTYGDLKLRAVWEELTFKFELKDDDTYKLVKYYKDDLFVVIPSEYEGKPVTEIGERTFADIKVLSVTLPEKLTVIGDLAFYHSRVAEIINLSNIDFTNASFTDYGWIAGAPKLVVKTGGTTDIYNVGDFYFLPFDGYEYLIYYAGTDKKVKIPELDGKKIIINSFAFERHGVEEVDMTANVCEIKEMGFLDCRSFKKIIASKSLAWLDHVAITVSTGWPVVDVFYLGNEEDWKKVSLTDTEDEPMYYNLNVYYYSEVKPAGDGKFWHYNENGEAVSW